MEKNGFCDDGCGTELTFWGVFLYSSLRPRVPARPATSAFARLLSPCFKTGRTGADSLAGDARRTARERRAGRSIFFWRICC